MLFLWLSLLCLCMCFKLFSVLFKISPIIIFYVYPLNKYFKVFKSFLHLCSNLLHYFCFCHIHIYRAKCGISIHTDQIRVSSIYTYSVLFWSSLLTCNIWSYTSCCSKLLWNSDIDSSCGGQISIHMKIVWGYFEYIVWEFIMW